MFTYTHPSIPKHVERQAGRQLTGKQADRQTRMQTYIYSNNVDRQIGITIHIHAGKQMGRQAFRQPIKHADM